MYVYTMAGRDINGDDEERSHNGYRCHHGKKAILGSKATVGRGRMHKGYNVVDDVVDDIVDDRLLNLFAKFLLYHRLASLARHLGFSDAEISRIMIPSRTPEEQCFQVCSQSRFFVKFEKQNFTKCHNINLECAKKIQIKRRCLIW